VYIVVTTITELKTPQSCHGKNLTRLARECFVNHQSLTVDFEGISKITKGFFQELFLPLVAEFGADYLKNRLVVANMAPQIDDLMKQAFSNLDAYFDSRSKMQGQECDEEIVAMNLAWLIKARELTRENPVLAELIMGINDAEQQLALSRMSMDDIQHIAESGWLCFSPRFSTHFVQSMIRRQPEVIDVLLSLSGSV